MSKVTVYPYEAYDIRTDEMTRSTQQTKGSGSFLRFKERNLTPLMRVD